MGSSADPKALRQVPFVNRALLDQERTDPLSGGRLLEKGFGQLGMADELSTDEESPSIPWPSDPFLD